ncbi:MAG: 1-acyl-sn-glycerol-3-phosphate acyltransferase, partial [Candidatus Nanopelagicaceae bacterium]
TKVSVIMGDPVDLSKWQGRAEDPSAVEEATDAIMDAITGLLEVIRGEKAPAVRFDPKKSSLPRTGNFKKKK